jgi:hypothetical protein
MYTEHERPASSAHSISIITEWTIFHFTNWTSAIFDCSFSVLYLWEKKYVLCIVQNLNSVFAENHMYCTRQGGRYSHFYKVFVSKTSVYRDTTFGNGNFWTKTFGIESTWSESDDIVISMVDCKHFSFNTPMATETCILHTLQLL